MDEQEFKGYSEVREIKIFMIKAKTKQDAEKVLKLAIGSQDEIVSMTGVRMGYRAEVSHLIARDWPSDYTPD